MISWPPSQVKQTRGWRFWATETTRGWSRSQWQWHPGECCSSQPCLPQMKAQEDNESKWCNARYLLLCCWSNDKDGGSVVRQVSCLFSVLASGKHIHSRLQDRWDPYYKPLFPLFRHHHHHHHHDQRQFAHFRHVREFFLQTVMIWDGGHTIRIIPARDTSCKERDTNTRVSSASSLCEE